MPRNRTKYLEQVASFIAKNGPAFTLAVIEDGPTRACDCCGYYPIKTHYNVENQSAQPFIIGSECQTWVLNFTDAHLPAAHVRKLEKKQLIQLGLKYGLTLLDKLGQDEMANQVIAARRRFANVAGWISRRVQGKAPAISTTPHEQLPLPLVK